MTRRTARKPRPPLNETALNELALAYVSRFATSRSKLASYLGRKIRERGWSGEKDADLQGLVERFASRGYVDDNAYAIAKSRSLSARGYGEARLRQSLRAAGIAQADATAAHALAEEDAVQSALRFARRRRFGPFATQPLERHAREKAIAAMIRAGHAFDLARAIIALEPGDTLNEDNLG